MKRRYFISDDLVDLEIVEQELEAAGVSTPQIHVLSEDDAGLEEHHLHAVESVLKKDVVRGTELGAVIGAAGAVIVLLVVWLLGWAENTTWVPWIFLAIIVLGFCTWEGGLVGIQEPHSEFRRFQKVLDAGKHVLFVDFDSEQEPILNSVVERHPRLKDAGEGAATPGLVVRFQDKWARFMKVAP